MAIDVFNLAAQSFVGGAVNSALGFTTNTLTTSAINAFGGNMMGGNVKGGLIMGTGMIPDVPYGMGSAGRSGYGSGLGRLNDPGGRFNDSFNNASESIGREGVVGTIRQLGLLVATGNLNNFGDNLLNNASNIATGVGIDIMGNLGAAAESSLISVVGNASLSDASYWLDSAADAISDSF